MLDMIEQTLVVTMVLHLLFQWIFRRVKVNDNADNAVVDEVDAYLYPIDLMDRFHPPFVELDDVEYEDRTAAAADVVEDALSGDESDRLFPDDEDDEFDILPIPRFHHRRRFRRPLHRVLREPLPPLGPPPPRPPSPPPPPPPYLKYLMEFPYKTVESKDGLEQVIPQDPNFDVSQLFIKRFTACVGWAVHGLVFEFQNGKRMGMLVKDGITQIEDLRDSTITTVHGIGWTNLTERGAWTYLEKGDYLTKIHGHRLDNTHIQYLCHSLTLEFASGKTVTYEATHEPWRGAPFSYAIPEKCLIFRLAFSRMNFYQDLIGLSTAIHLPISPDNLVDLPTKNQSAISEILEMTRDLDQERSQHDLKPMGEDLWKNILEYILVWEIKV